MHKVYEYKCPVCGHINRRDMVMGRVVCDKCGESFYPDKLQNTEDVMFLLRKILEAIDSLKASMPVYPYIPLPYQPEPYPTGPYPWITEPYPWITEPYPWITPSIEPTITLQDDGTSNSLPQYEVPKTTG